MSNFEEDNISRLKFIGKIKKGDKVNIKDMYVQPNNIITKINRSFVNVDNRNNTLSFILETIKKSFDELLNHLNRSKDNLFDLNISTNMVLDLENSKVGLVNLKDTYNDDLMFCCKIDTIIQDIDARLDELKSKYTFIKNKSSPISIPNKSIHQSPQMEPLSLPDSLPSSFDSVDSMPSVLTINSNNKNNKKY
jgi:hypothetical protein